MRSSGPHAVIGADLAKKYNEGKEIIHAIAAHHEDVPPTSILAVLVQAADGLSGARPGARKELLQNYVKRLEDLENIATSFDGVAKAYAIQAGQGDPRHGQLRHRGRRPDLPALQGHLRKGREQFTAPARSASRSSGERRAVGYAK